MSSESEYLLSHDVVPRLRSATPIAVAHRGSKEDAELLPAVGGTPAAAPETGALPIFKPPPGDPRPIQAFRNREPRYLDSNALKIPVA